MRVRRIFEVALIERMDGRVEEVLEVSSLTLRGAAARAGWPEYEAGARLVGAEEWSQGAYEAFEWLHPDGAVSDRVYAVKVPDPKRKRTTGAI